MLFTAIKSAMKADKEVKVVGSVVKWFVDYINDTHGNTINYSYIQNPNAEDNGSVYLDKIEYNDDLKRKITFTYESSARSDRRRVYEQGNLFEESRRLTDISVLVDNALVRRYHLTYTDLNAAFSAISKISHYGSDNSSNLYNISFEYYAEEVGYSNSSSEWVPPELFTDDKSTDFGVRLLDINSDGFIDVIKRYSNDNKTYINNKTSGWDLDTSWYIPHEIINSTDNSDLGVRFADINNDGFTDLIKARTDKSRKVYLNNGSDWVLSSSWNISVDFVDNSGKDEGVRLIDINNDGRVDLIKSNEITNSVYINNGSGWAQNSTWTFPTDITNSSNSDVGTRFVDLNGDGWTDIIRSSNLGSVVRETWLNNCSGWVNSTTWQPPVGLYFVDGSIEKGIRFVDVNGDGLVDMLISYANGGSNFNVWINKGDGWTQNDSWITPKEFSWSGQNVGRRLADVNGDGFADFILSYFNGSHQRSYLKNSTSSYLLKNITSEYGGVTSIDYTESTQYDNTENGLSRIGFNIFVVSEVIKNNSMEADFNIFGEISYNYSFGKFDYDKSEFRGFGLTNEIRPSSVIKHYFYQDAARKGKENQTEVYDKDDNLYSKTVRTYNWTYANDIYNLSLRSLTEYSYDGLESAEIRNKSFQYAFYGEPEYVVDYGSVNVSGDEKYFNYSYGYNFDDWIINKVARVTVYDSASNKSKETKYYYDDHGLNGIGSYGDLTKTEEWIDENNHSFRWFKYDDYGNLVSETDSLGNTVKYAYDEYNTFLKTSINALGHVASYDYDAGTGNLEYEERNGVRTSYEYDIFGRIEKEIRPYDSSDQPTKEYSYSFDGSAPEKIMISLKTTGNKTDDISYFYDGFANLVQMKTRLEGSEEVVKNIFYDTSFRVDYEQNPYKDSYSADLTNKSSSAGNTSYSYDALDRVIAVVNPDGTNKTVVFERYNVSDYDENENKHTYSLDAFGRISKVYEYNTDPFTDITNTYETSYYYDTNDNLIRIVDNEGNEFLFVYDAIGRKIKMVDPDMGTWTYEYDSNGNLIKQIDARGEEITLAYDVLNRVAKKNSSDVNLTFNYDVDYQGTLYNISFNGDSIEYEYDDRLRVIKETQSVNGVSFEKEFLYDSQNRLVSNNDLDYIYNKQGLVSEITGYVNDSSYNAFGSITSRYYGNGVNASFSYDSLTNRLSSIIAANVSNMSFTYDDVGNILSIHDVLSSTWHNMTYDSLDRMAEVSIGSDNYTYAYNSIGNILKIIENAVVKRFVYDDLPHAPSKILDEDVGVDVYDVSELDTGNKSRVFEFFLVNEKDSALDVNYSVGFGDGNIINSTIDISLNESVVVIVENNYSYGGEYEVNISAESSYNADDDQVDSIFGARAYSLKENVSSNSLSRFLLVIYNDVADTVYNVQWNCSNGDSSGSSYNLTANSNLTHLVNYTYSSSGDTNLSCTVTSDDGNESVLVSFEVPFLEVEDYDVLYVDMDRRIVSFDVVNDYTNQSVEVDIDTNSEDVNWSGVVIDEDEGFVFIAEVNYSADDEQEFEVVLSANGSTQSFMDRFWLRGTGIENYSRIEADYANYNLTFNIVNYWLTGLVNWKVSDPSNSSSDTLANDEVKSVFLPNTYSTQGFNTITVNSTRSSYLDFIEDYFEVRPLSIVSFETTAEATQATFELVVENKLNTYQVFDWRLDTGETNISSGSAVNLSADSSTTINISANYTGVGVFEAEIFVNSSSYEDSERSAVII